MKTTILSILALLLMTVTQGAWSQTHTVTFADGNDSEGWTISPTSGVEGTTVTVSYTGSHKVKSIAVTGQVSVTVNGYGTYSFQMPASDVEVSTKLWRRPQLRQQRRWQHVGRR